jgi:hypothetical protein
LIVEHRFPVNSAVYALEHSSGRSPEIVGIGIAGNAHDSTHPVTDRTNVSVFELLKRAVAQLLDILRPRWRSGSKRRHNQENQ